MRTLKRTLILALCALMLCAFSLVAIVSFVSFSEETSNYSKKDVFVLDSNIIGAEDEFVFPEYAFVDTLGDISDNGVAIFSSTSGASFTYKNPINFANITQDINLIEIYALFRENYSSMSEMTITLTDVDNPSNTVGVYFYSNSGNKNATYARVEYLGRSLARSNESSIFGKIWEGQYGAWCNTNFFSDMNGTATAGTNTVRPFSISLNYKEREIYLNQDKNKQHLLLDLNEAAHVGAGFEWQGFTNDKAILSVDMSFSNTKVGGCIVKSLLGKNLDGSLVNAEDFDAPEIDLLCDEDYLSEMPKGAVEIGYPLPDVYAFDWYFGEVSSENSSVRVYKKTTSNEYTVDCSNLIENGMFFAQDVGEYRVVYTQNNKFQTSEKYLDFDINERISSIVISQEQAYAEPIINDWLYIPNVDCYGGSGKLSCVETLFYNGQQVELTENRTIFIDKAGFVSLRVECTGYTGTPYVKYFSIEVKDSTVLTVKQMPMILQYGETVVFPKAVAYNSQDLTDAQLEISVDGVVLTSDRVYTVDKQTGFVNIKYKATTDLGVVERVYNVPVVNNQDGTLRPSNFLLTDSSDVVIEDSSFGVNVSTSTDKTEVYWAYPVVTGMNSAKMYINVSVIDGKENFNYLDVYLTDYNDLSIKSFIRFYAKASDKSESTYMQINGAGKAYEISGSLTNSAMPINVYVDANTHYIYNGANNAPICEFLGYDAQLSKISFVFSGVKGESGITIKKISNQGLNSNLNTDYEDRTRPVLSYSFAIDKTAQIKLGKTVSLPNAEVRDMLSNGGRVSVLVRSPSGKNILNTDELSNLSFVAEEVGQYRISYTYSDNNSRSGADVFFCESYDTVNPVLTVANNLSVKAKLFDVIIIPKATATDTVDGECKVSCFVRFINDYSIENVEMGSNYKFTKKGDYEIKYYTCDSNYNYTEYSLYIKVV